MRVDDESGESIIIVFINFISYHCQKIKSGENWIGEINIIIKVLGNIIGSLERICCGNDTAPGLKTCDNSSLGDGNGLLLHCLMD